MQFYDEESDIQWLKDTHLKNIEYPEFKSFCLYGSESNPISIHLYESNDPLYTDRYYCISEEITGWTE